MREKTIRRRPGTAGDAAPAEGGAAAEGSAPVPAPRDARPARRDDRGDDRRDRPRRTEADIRSPAPAIERRPEEITVSPRLSELEAIAGLADIDMAGLMAAAPVTRTKMTPGMKLKGVVTGRSHDELQVDIGGRSTGFIQLREAPNAKVGDTIEAYVVKADELGVQLSVRLSGQAAAAHLADAVEAGIPVEGVVSSRNPGGYEVKIGGVRAFCPVSHISRIPLSDPDQVLGQTLPFLVIEVSDRVIVSRRQLEQRQVAEAKAQFWTTARTGDIRTATITHVAAWGAFVDVDGVEGRMPKKEFGWEEIEDLTTRLQRGQQLQVRLIDVDPAAEKLTVSTRDPALDPWLNVGGTLQAGEVRQGKVISQTPYGAFVEVAPGLHGLMHVSRMAGAPLPAPGTVVAARVLNVDPQQRRIELAHPSFDPAAQAANAVGAQVEGVIEEVQPMGIRIRLADGRTGWLPEREVDLAPGQHLSSKYRRGGAITARVSGEQPGGRVSLTLRDDDAASAAQAWRQHAAGSAKSGMGTLGDLFKRR